MPVAVSVIVPTFNRLAYLREAIDSVLAQTIHDWELLVVDDGSTDGTIQYLGAIADPRVRVVPLAHCGRPGRVKNAALPAAVGRHVAFLDSDDAWEPTKLERQLEALRQHPRAGWSYTDVKRVNTRGELLPEGGIQPWRACSGPILADLLRMDALVATPTVIVERSLVEQVGGFDESLDYNFDYDLWFRIGAISDARAVPERLARVRVHDGARTVDRRAVHRSWVRVYEKAAAAAADPGIGTICRTRGTYHRITAASLAADSGRASEAVRGFAAAMIRDPLSGPLWRCLAGRALPRSLRRNASLSRQSG
ncbi:MAG TPA: glycosyltransferase [Vicinamibacterales bacterium]|nr:glycosyltransferase [Vicinamibacterales bacterium]